MSKWSALLKKENLELLRNYKWLVIPIVFIILGAMQPITYYYLPDILKMAAMPDGSIIQIPVPTPSETMISVFQQLAQLGIIIIILTSMGTVANEIKYGITDMILVKPITSFQYITSKWFSYYGLTIVSTLLGILSGMFYTFQLIGTLSLVHMLQTSLVFLLFQLFFVSFTILLSSMTNSSITAGGIGISFVVLLSIIGSLPLKLWWLPSYLFKGINGILYQKTTDYFWLSILMTIVYILIMLLFNIYFFTKRIEKN